MKSSSENMSWMMMMLGIITSVISAIIVMFHPSVEMRWMLGINVAITIISSAIFFFGNHEEALRREKNGE